MKIKIFILFIFVTIIFGQELNNLKLSPTSKLLKYGTSSLSDDFTSKIVTWGPCGYNLEHLKSEYIFCAPINPNRECGICYKFTNPKTGKNSFGITGDVCNNAVISYEASKNMTINNILDPELKYIYEKTDDINCPFFLDYAKGKRRKK